MKMTLYILLVLAGMLPIGNRLKAQVTDSLSVPLFSGRMVDQVQQKINTVEKGLTQKTARYLQRWLRREEKLRRKLTKLNPELASRLFAQATDSLQNTIARLGQAAPVVNNTVNNYLPSLDSLGTMLQFLQRNPLSNAPQAVTTALNQLQQLKGRLQQTASVQQYLKERKAILMQQLGNLPGFGKHLKKINQEAYYYGQMVQEWKAVLSDPKRLEQKALQLLRHWPAFNDFMAKNSELARLFPGLGNGNAAPSGFALAGLQTRSQVNNLLQNQWATSGSNLPTGQAGAQQMLQAQMGNAMQQLEQLKNGDFGNNTTAADMPNFQPNAMRHKRFISRLEPGFNVQMNKNSRYFPITADVGIQLRYALSKNAGVGIGASYKAGLGTGWGDMRLTHNGMGLRSFADWRFKGQFWFNAGAEFNYATGFTNLNQLKDYNSWRGSALAGISKKFNLGKKTKGSVLLLYDFLHSRHRPMGQPFVYRITYNLK